MIINKIILCNISSRNSYHSNMDQLVVTVKQGTLQGILKSSVFDTQYVAFKGIPFAAPPIGELRFKVGSISNTNEMDSPNPIITIICLSFISYNKYYISKFIRCSLQKPHVRRVMLKKSLISLLLLHFLLFIALIFNKKK